MRLVDANLDRGGEALRFLDDLARFNLDDQVLSTRLRALRHALGDCSAQLTIERLAARDVAEDIGAEATADERTSLVALGEANARRAAESLRSLEEAAKLPEMAGKLDSEVLRRLRFEVYEIEKELVPRLTRKLKTGSLAGIWLEVECGAVCGRDAREIITQAVRGGAKGVIYHPQGEAGAGDFELGGWLREATTGQALLLADCLEAALASNADGYVLKRGGLSLEAARRVLKLDRLMVAAAADSRESRILANAGADAVIIESVIGLKDIRAIHNAIACPVMVQVDPSDKYQPILKAGVQALVFRFHDPRVASAGFVRRLAEESGQFIKRAKALDHIGVP
jgi:hypothetical protein